MTTRRRVGTETPRFCPQERSNPSPPQAWGQENLSGRADALLTVTVGVSGEDTVRGEGSERAAVREPDQCQLGYLFLVGAVLGTPKALRRQKYRSSPVCHWGVRVTGFRANSGVRQVSAGSNNVGLGVSPGWGARSDTFLAGLPTQLTALFTSP